jgi:hypothetical protein
MPAVEYRSRSGRLSLAMVSFARLPCKPPEA